MNTQLNDANDPCDDAAEQEKAQALIQGFMDSTLLAVINRAGGVLRIPFSEIDRATGGFHMKLEDRCLVLTAADFNPAMPVISDENDLLRSAYQVALRKGEDTNWEALTARLKTLLCRYAGANPTDDLQLARATGTPKTYRAPRVV